MLQPMQAVIPPSLMLPENRLEELVEQVWIARALSMLCICTLAAWRLLSGALASGVAVRVALLARIVLHALKSHRALRPHSLPLQALVAQMSNCRFHNAPDARPSLLFDYSCGTEQLPTCTTQARLLLPPGVQLLWQDGLLSPASRCVLGLACSSQVLVDHTGDDVAPGLSSPPAPAAAPAPAKAAAPSVCIACALRRCCWTTQTRCGTWPSPTTAGCWPHVARTRQRSFGM